MPRKPSPLGPNQPNPEASTGTSAFQPTPLTLLERIRANDQDAWRRLLDLYQPLVGFWCTQGGLSAEDLADVTQEVFAAAARGLPGFRRDRPGDTFRGWLRGITRNQILQLHRRNQGKPRAEGGSDAFTHLEQIPDPVPPDQAESEEISNLYRRALEHVRKEFDERQWQAFWLTVVEGRLPASLTAELGMTAVNIRQVKSRILRRVKREFGELLV
jgi:RNA polymerase sigma-70 factor (ECF subfamily)